MVGTLLVFTPKYHNIRHEISRDFAIERYMRYIRKPHFPTASWDATTCEVVVHNPCLNSVILFSVRILRGERELTIALDAAVSQLQRDADELFDQLYDAQTTFEALGEDHQREKKIYDREQVISPTSLPPCTFLVGGNCTAQ